MSHIQKKNNKPASSKAALAAFIIGAVLLSSTFLATARDYKVEVILFENNNPSAATESHDYQEPKRMKSGSKAWLLSPTMLNDEAKTLSASPKYTVKHHYSWGIESLPYQQSASYSIAERDAHGYIKVYADQLLFTNIDLDYNGFRLKEKRRLKLNERHFFDHPKFGLLMQVSRLEPKLEPKTETEDELEAEPKATLSSSR